MPRGGSYLGHCSVEVIHVREEPVTGSLNVAVHCLEGGLHLRETAEPEAGTVQGGPVSFLLPFSANNQTWEG